MELDAPAPAVRRAVRGAIAWFRENALYGFDYQVKGGRTARAGAGPLWARFAEIGTNRAIFSNRDGVVLYDFDRLDEERRTGYGWYTEEPAGALKRYRDWQPVGAPASEHPLAQTTVIVDARSPAGDGELAAGVPTFRSINAALAAAPAEDGSAYVIRIRPGRYYEKLHVERADVHLVGAGPDSTVLTYDAVAGGRAPGGWPWGTRGTATLRVAAPGFRLEGVTVENGFDYLANYRRPVTDSARLRDAQAVAVMLDEGSDRAVFRDCRITGHQDTLFPNAGRAWFHHCTISGSVDFIFGAGRVLFEESVIVSRDRGSRTNNGYITAPSTPASQPHGFVFRACRLEKESPALAAGSVSLGRPWHPAGDPRAVGQAVFIDCWMDDHIGAAGWAFMNSTDAAGRITRHEPDTAHFYESGTQGPGAPGSPARRLLGAAERGRYDVAAVLDGWDPRT
ncbi:MAG: pectinesterase A [Gemmatimonadetes bacterium]|nr:pectinesterase A [Gemmatimonadota bacterium]